ncbi:hypothetical protein QQM39_00295 [Streptomyces sp. DT2A-34]|uniref:hypothetical protein n=1 Tax=Streptomyces sp. DT2A-34 TaxID=3051182 RepID=UPI00265B9307|nr:hypothetical protein [Streptomyces sp. DT2A-34]MDO0909360.1 hypothetical protein [Streptomyces sp. DT2A-34]
MTEREAVFRLVDGMRDWIRGNPDWGIASGRYRVDGSDRAYADDLLTVGREG